MLEKFWNLKRKLFFLKQILFYSFFQTRLQYFALAIQGYIRKLDEFLKGKSRLDLKNEDVQLKIVAQRSAKNISAIIKDLFHSPPSYKTKVIVSWRPLDDKVKILGRLEISLFSPQNFFENFIMGTASIKPCRLKLNFKKRWRDKSKSCNHYLWF